MHHSFVIVAFFFVCLMNNRDRWRG